MRNSSPIVLGEIIADKYQVEGVIGEGGMGLVVSAWHLGLRQRVAIKLLMTDGGQLEASAIERFQREARAAARIRSEHVCRVLDVGMLPGGTPYLVMEYLEGCDLADELARRGRLPPAEAVGYVLEACEALAEAHVAGIIHRDLKPANLFLARHSSGSRCLKLLDFGVSKSLSSSSVAQLSLTKTSSVVGSPIYMSPEQLNSAKDVDTRTDIWALGVLTYELITGRTPFYGDTIPQLVNAVLHAEPASFSELGLTVPGGLESAVRRALSKSRELRFATVGEFATALGPFAPDDSISVSRILRIKPASDTRDPLPETLDDRDVRRTPRSGGVATPPQPTPNASAARSEKKASFRWAWVALALVIVAGIAAVLSRQGGPQARVREGVVEGDVVAADAGTEKDTVVPAASATTAPPMLPVLPRAEPVQGKLAPVDDPRDASTSAAKRPSRPAARPAPPKPSKAEPDELTPTISNFGGRR